MGASPAGLERDSYSRRSQDAPRRALLDDTVVECVDDGRGAVPHA
jgi:hypothetical protein